MIISEKKKDPEEVKAAHSLKHVRIGEDLSAITCEEEGQTQVQNQTFLVNGNKHFGPKGDGSLLPKRPRAGNTSKTTRSTCVLRASCSVQLFPILHYSSQNMASVGKLFGAEEEEIIFNVRGFESHKNYHLSLKIALSSSLKICFGSWRT